MSGQPEGPPCVRGRGMMARMAFSISARLSVKSWANWPDVVLIATRSLGAKAPKKRVAESRTNTASCIDMWTSSKTMETKRCGKTAAFPAMTSALEDSPSVVEELIADAVCDWGVSMLNDEMV